MIEIHKCLAFEKMIENVFLIKEFLKNFKGLFGKTLILLGKYKIDIESK